MSGIEELRRRVAEATGPDDQLDRDIAIDLRDWSDFIQIPTRNINEMMLAYTGTDSYPVLSFAAWPEKVTSSIDAALALVERVLPGWAWYVADSDARNGRPVASMYDRDEMLRTGKVPRSEGATPALAILSALLAALPHPSATEPVEGG